MKRNTKELFRLIGVMVGIVLANIVGWGLAIAGCVLIVKWLW